MDSAITPKIESRIYGEFCSFRSGRPKTARMAPKVHHSFPMARLYDFILFTGKTSAFAQKPKAASFFELKAYKPMIINEQLIRSHIRNISTVIHPSPANPIMQSTCPE